MDNQALKEKIDVSRSMGCNIGAPTMTRAQCEAGVWPHNHRCRFTTGFYCEDCGTWIEKSNELWYFTNSFGNRQDRSKPDLSAPSPPGRT